MKRAILCFAALLVCRDLSALSVLAHEAIIDTTWKQDIQPLLLKRFPQATEEDLLKARAYAYGGSIIQDMGYYPSGSKLFTDIAHYVRSGDFILNLLAEARDLNEYSFALGALAHYSADNDGHAIAVNPTVGMEFPKLRKKYGPVVTYEDNPIAHLRVEFSFDVQQVYAGNYAPKAYHDFIGFEVSKPVLERAFQDTYGLHIEDIFDSFDEAVGMYRYTVSVIIPEMTRAAWKRHKDELMRADPTITRRRFAYTISRPSYRREWGDHEPGLDVRLLVAVVRVLPKVGPLKATSFKPPVPAATTDFEGAFVTVVNHYRSLLAESAKPGFSLPNRNFDTGKPTRPAEYRLADDAYGDLAIRLAKLDPSRIDPKLRDNVLAYFNDRKLPFATKQDHKEWRRTQEALDHLRGTGTPVGVADDSQQQHE